MTIKQYQALEPIEQFKIMIDRLKNDTYINNDGLLINVFTDYRIIEQELKLFGIDAQNKTFDEVLQEITNFMFIESWLHFISSDFKKLILLRKYIFHLGFYIYDYEINTMPKHFTKEFEIYKKYSLFFKKRQVYNIYS